MKLESRDKKTLLIGGVAAALILLYVYVFSPLTDDLGRKRDLIPKREKELAEMREMAKQYQEIQKRLKDAQAVSSQRGPLLTEIENLTRRANLSSKIVSLKPQTGTQAAGYTESVVEVRLDNITLYDVVNYVFLLEKSAFRIKKLTFKPRYDNPKLLNATILVASVG